MQVHEIQSICLEELRHIGIHLLRSTPYSMSGEPIDPEFVGFASPNGFLFQILATRPEFEAFKAVVELRGIHLNFRWKPQHLSSKFLYEIQAVERW